jgi:hypothetical protein
MDTSSQSNSIFFKLPTEIRLEVYKIHLFREPSPLMLNPSFYMSGYPPKYHLDRSMGPPYSKYRPAHRRKMRLQQFRKDERLGILRTCQVIYSEAVPLLYEKARFDITVSCASQATDYPPSQIYMAVQPPFHLIQHLSVQMHYRGGGYDKEEGSVEKHLAAIFTLCDWGSRLRSLALEISDLPHTFDLSLLTQLRLDNIRLSAKPGPFHGYEYKQEFSWDEEGGQDQVQDLMDTVRWLEGKGVNCSIGLEQPSLIRHHPRRRLRRIVEEG